MRARSSKVSACPVSACSSAQNPGCRRPELRKQLDLVAARYFAEWVDPSRTAALSSPCHWSATRLETGGERQHRGECGGAHQFSLCFVPARPSPVDPARGACVAETPRPSGTVAIATRAQAITNSMMSLVVCVTTSPWLAARDKESGCRIPPTLPSPHTSQVASAKKKALAIRQCSLRVPGVRFAGQGGVTEGNGYLATGSAHRLRL